jgi:pimeloyl-ACP methyl ester carboxylesterase
VSDSVDPFTIHVGHAVLDDLRSRLRGARLAPDFGNDDWSYGVNGEYLAELITYWAEEYDWRAHERAMNLWDHYRTTVDGLPIHFLQAPGQGPRPMPLILTHGWPWTFWDFKDLIGPLSDPASYGGDPADAFDVIVPSLPGFGFSTPMRRAGWTIWDVAGVWVKLMDRLGYDRFAVHGGDFGVLVAGQLGHQFADRLYGLHVAPRPMPLHIWNVDRPWADLVAGSLPASDQAEDRAAFVAWERKKVGHATAHILGPQTLAHALHDSPAGMASWLLERRRSWSDCGGDVEAVFTKDTLLTSFTLYWVTECFVTSARLYADNSRYGWAPSHDRRPVIEAPTAVTVFEKDMPPKSAMDWMTQYANVEFVEYSSTGGHFAAAEKPELIVDNLRTFFRGKRLA